MSTASEIVRKIALHKEIPRKVIFSGIQPTGVPHLGNYLGALRPWVKLQTEEKKDTKLIFCIVDQHAITVKQNSGDMRRWNRESLAILLAIGLNPDRSIIYRQSDVPAHSQLMWNLSCFASMGQLSRMTQWKSKLALPENAKPMESPLQLGLFSYPVLQAADILVHGATHVPVGEDQSQHIEFTRDLATTANSQYGKGVFHIPEAIISPAKRIMSLTEPSKKMSKSDVNHKSRILLSDSLENITKKVKAAVTDSLDGVMYDPENRPEIANLINIMYHLQDAQEMSQEELAADCSSKSALKDKLITTINDHIAPIRERFVELTSPGKKEYLANVRKTGSQKAKISANPMIIRVRAATYGSSISDRAFRAKTKTSPEETAIESEAA